MDLNAINGNVTIDDFDSILTYSDQAQWSTPDPSANGYKTDGSPWMMATYHNTTVNGASLTFNFTGAAVYLFGGQGPAYGTFEVVIDGQVLKGVNYRQGGSNNSSQLLFGTNALTFANHEIVLRNTGADQGDSRMGNALLFDYAIVSTQLAPAGATVNNKTYQESDPAIKYSGTWNNNQSPLFSGGGTTFTDDDGGSFELTFQGSAIYIFGDKKNNHRGYTVTLDSQPPLSYNGTSGCGGKFDTTCEQQNPCIKFLATNLGEGDHVVKLVNNAVGPGQTTNSFFDLDSIIVSVPSVYAPRNLSTSSSPFLEGNSSITSSGSPKPSSSSMPTSTPGVSNGASSLMVSQSFLLLIIGVWLLLKPWSGFRASRHI